MLVLQVLFVYVVPTDGHMNSDVKQQHVCYVDSVAVSHAPNNLRRGCQ